MSEIRTASILQSDGMTWQTTTYNGYEMPDGTVLFGIDAAERAAFAWQKETVILLREILIRLDARS